MQTQAAAYRLSPLQARLWLGQEVMQGAPQCSFLIEGTLDGPKLARAFEEVTQRHEILRTVFPAQAGLKVPFQVVKKELAPAWNILDWRGADQSRLTEIVREWMEKASAEWVDLSVGPILKITLATLSDSKSVLIFSASAASADLRSLQIIAGETFAIYAGKRGELSASPLQYADYSEWANNLLDEESDEAKAGQEFWQGLDLAASSAPKLPLELLHPQTSANGSLSLPLAATVTNKIESFAQSQQASFAEVMFASWTSFLFRLSGNERLTVEQCFDGRDAEETADAVGRFARYLPIVSDFDSQTRFTDLVRTAQSALTVARQWQDHFRPERVGRPSIYLPIGFEFRAASDKCRAGNLEFSELVASSGDKFKLKLECTTASTTFRYDAAWLRPKEVAYLADLFSTFLESLVNQPAGRIVSAAILSSDQRRQVLVDWQATSTPYRDRDCIHYLFEEAAERVPNSPALAFRGNVLNYSELNARANQVAHLLRGLGVGPDIPVALCMERSADMMVALLGILKAGGAYVPLVHDNPKARLAHQLAETKAPVLLTHQQLLSNLPEFGGQTICMDRDSARFDAESIANPTRVNSSEDLVYVIYTSGSTGLPKGVAVRHRNLVNYTQAILGLLGTSGDQSSSWNFATVSTISADLGNTCIFPAWASGGCLHVIDFETSMDVNAFAEYAKSNPIDVLKITPSHLAALLALPRGAEMLPKKYLFCGGDALSWELVRQIAAGSSANIINHYGPTETTIGSLTFQIPQDARQHDYATKVPIGKALANTQVLVLDPEGNPCPIGVAGELHIAGAGVARGYLQQPSQTAERFLQNKFTSAADSRMYKTGDSARFLPDGTVEFLGRVDHQVKIRGFRVEPGEVEAVLKTHTAVRQAVVTVIEDAAAEKKLVGYVVPSSQALTTELLRGFAAERLPDYMVPSAFVLLKEFPLTANGKIDRAALPDPNAPASRFHTHVAPRNDVEESVAAIWAQVLKLERVSIEDNFFALGGHSLLATQVISRVQSAFGVQVPLRTLFEAPTVAGLSARIAELTAQRAEDPEIAKMLGELENLSEEDAERMLAAESESADGASNAG